VPCVVVDGIKESVDGRVESLSFTPDSGRAWFIDRVGRQKKVVFGGADGDLYDDLALFTFSPRGDRLAYVGRRGAGYCVVSGGRKSQDFDEVWSVTFNAEATSISFDAREGLRPLARRPPPEVTLWGPVS